MRKSYFILALCWTLFVAVMCLIDLSDVKTPKQFTFPHIDKIVHTLFYTIISFLWGMTFLRKDSPKISNNYVLLIICIGFGILIELLQGFGGFNRSFEWEDILANSIGVFLGYIICLKILTFKPHNS